MGAMDLNFITSQIIKAAIAVHKALGPGLLESVYQKCMVIELDRMGIRVESELELPIFYRDQKITDLGFRIDLLVESVIIVELESVETVKPVHRKQLLTYLRLAEKEIGLLINFNEVLLKDGISRIINKPL
jgi:GxxExxY protein